MWHEVRKQERKIRCMIVDYKRRAERRKDYYEKIKADPTQFIQIHGRPCKIHLDPAVAAAGDSPAIMMGWQGGQDVIIDRFDVRAHLDYIPEVKQKDNEEDLSYDDRQVNYERYRILAQNDFLGVSEEKFLHQIYLEEQFGAIPRANEVPIEGKKKVPGATIGYNYDDPSTTPLPIAEDAIATEEPPVPPVEENEDDDDSDLDFDMCVDVNKVTTQQAHELNSCALIYGMEGNDFFSFLTKDKEEAETLRLAKELEEEKAMYSGRKSRRERRAYREKKLAGRKISPPSYASRKSPTYRDYRDIRSSHSKSRSASPVNSGQITYITSFGGDEPPPTTPHMTKSNSHRSTSNHGDYSRTVRYKSKTPDRSTRSRRRSRSSSRSPSRRHRTSNKHYRRSRSRSRSKSRTRSYSSAKPSSSSSLRHRNRSRSRSRSKSKNRSSSRKSSEHSNTATRHVGASSVSSSHSKSPVGPPQKSLIGSKSPARNQKTEKSPSPKLPPPPVMRYYGRRKNSSSSELSLSGDDDDDDDNMSSSSNRNVPDKKSWSQIGNSSSRNKPSQIVSDLPKLTPQERLKKKMQNLLNKQYKADKKAEREKQEKVEQERIDREDEMRELSIKLRKRERMRRHEYFAENRRRSGSSKSRSSSRSRSPSPHARRERRRRSRSRSVDSYHRRSNRPLVDY